MRLTTTIAMLAAMSACATTDEGGARPDDTEGDWRTGGKGDGETCDFDAMTAATFFDQFAYAETVTESGSKWYRVGVTFNLQATLDNGDDVDLDVYFLPDNRVIVEYSEEHFLGGNQSEVLNQTVIVTRRSIDPETRVITIDGVGTGTPATAFDGNGNCGPGIDFTFSGDVRSAGIAGDFTQIVAGSTTAYVIDPDHLDDVPSEAARRYFEEDVASGKITVVRK